MSNRDSSLQPATAPSPTPARGGPRGSRMGLAALAIILILTTAVLPFVADAGTNRAGNSVSVESGQRIVGDLNAAGRTVTIAGTVTGDANVTGGDVTIPGTVEGSANLAAGQVDISGAVGESVRIFGGQIDVTGTVGGDLIVFGGKVNVPSQAKIGGNVLIAGGQVDIRGAVNGDLRITSSNVTLGGLTSGDAEISASSIDLLDTARVGGKLTYTSSSSADIAPNAVVTGETVHHQPSAFNGGVRGIFNPWLRVIWALMAGIVIVALAPRFMSAVGGSGRRVLPAFGIGILSLILIPIIAIVLMATVVGLPIGLIVLAGYLIALYLSQVIVGMMIGRLLLSGRWDDGSRGFNLLCMTLGVIIISAIRFIPLPFVWGGVNAIVAIWGVGTVVMLFGRLRPAATRQARAAGATGSALGR
ncbi:MAG TPA: hypothetical protein VNZ55_12995 [Thermomicrobiales bacterium]|nr:hypothetical protein [Thermomicrobiales bacterium]